MRREVIPLPYSIAHNTHAIYAKVNIKEGVSFILSDINTL